ncbi:hypothetical protein MIDIC_140056 [Alphaproteobacteria bacterium]
MVVAQRYKILPNQCEVKIYGILSCDMEIGYVKRRALNRLTLVVVLSLLLYCHIALAQTKHGGEALHPKSGAVLATASNERQKGVVTGLAIPRFVTLKGKEANLRTGPGGEYQIKLTYKCKGYPVEIIAEFENWRMVRDINNNEGWLHEGLLSGIRNVIIKNNKRKLDILLYQVNKEETVLFRLPSERSHPLLRMEVGVVVKLRECRANAWCKVMVNGAKGWVQKENLWGVYSNE